ncbi:RagB/SusD family nutrient uptake outer membrane protein [Algibacter miyuki]|uniref:RagB/SusD family nutrient uptake outer membrane protein n=1 Tax=Algibacter miyuki TaxID=1306933 RepID=A0ABV5H4Q4_9FLAO|nr:RagB/SusD family nutrient uptake outer membrane protein [Algibacter miyuki]MDN3665817.1 RagB/SusD family nutrient uptake outer membrane protein [Algibacter miyuki]
MKQYRNITFSILFGLTLLTSCESMLEVEPEEVLLAEDYLGDDQIDARSALFGVLSQMQEVVGQYVVLGELRADLANVTASTIDELREVNNHDISTDNSYADLTTMFSIINNCNFALEGIDTQAYEEELLEDYASILRIRTWAQMQILINYGKLPYITKPIRTSDDLDDTYPLLSFDEGIDQLIANLQGVMNVENVSKYAGSLGFEIFKMIPDQFVLLGDLNLWKGNNTQAATYYMFFLNKAMFDGRNYNLSSNTITVTENNDNYTYSDGWADIFDESVRTNEVIDYVAFSEQFRQPNNSFEVVTKQLQASTSIITNWNSQSMGYEGEAVEDNRDERAKLSATIEAAEPLISKYQYDYFSWTRVAKVYLRYAEAINYAGHPEQALAIVNGIFNNPNVDPVDAPIFENEEWYLNFDMEVYYTVNNSDEPVSGNLGVRGRAGLAPVGLDLDLTSSTAIEEVGALILNEAALELAFEGNRWEDLMRFSIRANNPDILADAVADKFITSGDAGTGATIKQKLQNPENWFLPYTIPDNFVSN